MSAVRKPRFDFSSQFNAGFIKFHRNARNTVIIVAFTPNFSLAKPRLRA
jgi:hypothetical protein